jgi:GntR family transcriptional regulator of arabinose operon
MKLDANDTKGTVVKGKADAEQPKYLRIVESLRASLEAGRYRNGERLPSEAELVRKFGVSRMTAVKAMQHLRQQGLLVRRTGSGSFAAENGRGEKPVFGLIIPDLGETEIFEPICKGMAASPNSAGHSLSWGQSLTRTNKEDAAEQLCEQYIAQRVSGVFFAPLEFAPHRDLVNRRVLKMLKQAHIPVVLLDRCAMDYPARSEYDIVGLDNRRAGFVVAEHLIRQGAKRLGFLARKGSVETVEDRIVGYREALYAHGREFDRNLLLRIDPTDSDAVGDAIAHHGIDGLLCSNDRTAAEAMRTMLALGLRIPQEVRVAGFDDVRYAELLPVALTTMHQPCLQIGEAAIATMLDRITNPHLAPRSVLLNGRLVVRKSCGISQ